MSKQIVKKENDIQVFTDTSFMGVSDDISANDIQIPTLILMQSNSEFVQENDDINAGDFLHSITHEVWGKKDKEPVELIMFYMYKTLVVSDVTDGKKKWTETRPWEPIFETYDYEQVIDGRTYRNEKCYNYAAFRSLDVIEVEGENGTEYVAQPVIVKFKGGSLKNGKRLNSMFQNLSLAKQPSWVKTVKLVANLEEKDGSKYWAYDFKIGQNTMKEQQLAALGLRKQFEELKSNNALNVVDSEESAKDSKETKRTVKNYATGEEIQI